MGILWRRVKSLLLDWGYSVKTDLAPDINNTIKILLYLPQPSYDYRDLPHIVAMARYPGYADVERFEYAQLNALLEIEIDEATRRPLGHANRLSLVEQVNAMDDLSTSENELKNYLVQTIELLRYLKVTRPGWVVMKQVEIEQRMNVAWSRLPGESAPKFENGMVSYQPENVDGMSEARWQPLRNYEKAQKEGYESWQTRLSIGRYTLREAALAFSKATGENAREFCDSLTEALMDGTVPLYKHSSNARAKRLVGVKLSLHEIYFNEVRFKSLNDWLEKEEVYELICWRFPAPQELKSGLGVPEVLKPAKELNKLLDDTNNDRKRWLEIDSSDPPPDQHWYTPARYFARKLVADDPTLFSKKRTLATKVAKCLTAAGIFKRGNKKAPNATTVLKAFTNVVLG